jgi:hypothetical protein
MTATAEERLWPVVDETLPHQIVLRFKGVSCNCRKVTSRPGPGADGWEFFAPLGTADQCLAAYGNPRNHVGEFP